MTHYRQIILNLAVEDEGQDQEEYMEELKEKLVGFTKDNAVAGKNSISKQ